MPKSHFRIVALLLVPCLIADPVAAAGLGVLPADSAHRLDSRFKLNQLFQQQAFSPRGETSPHLPINFTGRPTSKTDRELEAFSSASRDPMEPISFPASPGVEMIEGYPLQQVRSINDIVARLVGLEFGIDRENTERVISNTQVRLYRSSAQSTAGHGAIHIYAAQSIQDSHAASELVSTQVSENIHRFHQVIVEQDQTARRISPIVAEAFDALAGVVIARLLHPSAGMIVQRASWMSASQGAYVLRALRHHHITPEQFEGGLSGQSRDVLKEIARLWTTDHPTVGPVALREYIDSMVQDFFQIQLTQEDPLPYGARHLMGHWLVSRVTRDLFSGEVDAAARLFGASLFADISHFKSLAAYHEYLIQSAVSLPANPVPVFSEVEENRRLGYIVELRHFIQDIARQPIFLPPPPPGIEMSPAAAARKKKREMRHALVDDVMHAFYGHSRRIPVTGPSAENKTVDPLSGREPLLSPDRDDPQILIAPIPETHPPIVMLSGALFSLLSAGERRLLTFSVPAPGSPMDISERIEIAMALEAVQQAKARGFKGAGDLEQWFTRGNVLFLKKSFAQLGKRVEVDKKVWETLMMMALPQWHRDHPALWNIFVQNIRAQQIVSEGPQGQVLQMTLIQRIDLMVEGLTQYKNVKEIDGLLRQIFPDIHQEIDQLLTQTMPDLNHARIRKLAAKIPDAPGGIESYFEWVEPGVQDNRRRVFAHVLESQMGADLTPDAKILMDLAKIAPSRMTPEQTASARKALQNLEIPFRVFFGKEMTKIPVRGSSHHPKVHAGGLATAAALFWGALHQPSVQAWLPGASEWVGVGLSILLWAAVVWMVVRLRQRQNRRHGLDTEETLFAGEPAAAVSLNDHIEKLGLQPEIQQSLAKLGYGRVIALVQRTPVQLRNLDHLSETGLSDVRRALARQNLHLSALAGNAQYDEKVESPEIADKASAILQSITVTTWAHVAGMTAEQVASLDGVTPSDMEDLRRGLVVRGLAFGIPVDRLREAIDALEITSGTLSKLRNNDIQKIYGLVRFTEAQLRTLPGLDNPEALREIVKQQRLESPWIPHEHEPGLYVWGQNLMRDLSHTVAESAQDLGMSGKLITHLRNAGIQTLGDMVAKSEKEWLTIQFALPYIVEEIKKVAVTLRVSLGSRAENWWGRLRPLNHVRFQPIALGEFFFEAASRQGFRRLWELEVESPEDRQKLIGVRLSRATGSWAVYPDHLLVYRHFIDSLEVMYRGESRYNPDIPMTRLLVESLLRVERARVDRSGPLFDSLEQHAPARPREYIKKQLAVQSYIEISRRHATQKERLEDLARYIWFARIFRSPDYKKYAPDKNSFRTWVTQDVDAALNGPEADFPWLLPSFAPDLVARVLRIEAGIRPNMLPRESAIVPWDYHPEHEETLFAGESPHPASTYAFWPMARIAAALILLFGGHAHTQTPLAKRPLASAA